jgi:hypothetical protein
VHDQRGWEEVSSPYSNDDVLAAIVERLITGCGINDGQSFMREVATSFLVHEQPTPVRSSMPQPAIPHTIAASSSTSCTQHNFTHHDCRYPQSTENMTFIAMIDQTRDTSLASSPLEQIL